MSSPVVIHRQSTGPDSCEEETSPSPSPSPGPRDGAVVGSGVGTVMNDDDRRSPPPPTSFFARRAHRLRGCLLVAITTIALWTVIAASGLLHVDDVVISVVANDGDGGRTTSIDDGGGGGAADRAVRSAAVMAPPSPNEPRRREGEGTGREWNANVNGTTTTTTLIDRSRFEEGCGGADSSVVRGGSGMEQEAEAVAEASRGRKAEEPACREARGRFGVWTYQDKPASWWQGQPSNVTANLTSGDWDWHDDMEISNTSSSYLNRHDCRPLTRVATTEVLCRELRRLSVTRMFFVGDSTTHMMVSSLWRLLSLPGRVPSQFRPFRRTVTCPPGNDTTEGEEPPPFQFEISFTRNDHLNRNLDPNRNRRRNGPACGVGMTYCWPWLDSYRNGTTTTLDDGPKSSSTTAAAADVEGGVGGGRGRGRTLLIVNMGVHFHNRGKYEDAIDDFFDVTVPTYVDSNDVVWFRLSVPGHGDCDGHTVPFADYEQYEPTRTSRYDWDLVEGFNDYVRSKVINATTTATVNATAYARAQGVGSNETSSLSPVVELLDVFNMTVLRRDGHRGGKDCLHYEEGVPNGPVDWWVHLMTSNLVDLPAPSAVEGVYRMQRADSTTGGQGRLVA